MTDIAHSTVPPPTSRLRPTCIKSSQRHLVCSALSRPSALLFARMKLHSFGRAMPNQDKIGERTTHQSSNPRPMLLQCPSASADECILNNGKQPQPTIHPPDSEKRLRNFDKNMSAITKKAACVRGGVTVAENWIA